MGKTEERALRKVGIDEAEFCRSHYRCWSLHYNNSEKMMCLKHGSDIITFAFEISLGSQRVRGCRKGHLGHGENCRL